MPIPVIKFQDNKGKTDVRSDLEFQLAEKIQNQAAAFQKNQTYDSALKFLFNTNFKEDPAKGIPVDTLSKALHNIYMTEEHGKLMAEFHLDQFDMIQIDGVSVREYCTKNQLATDQKSMEMLIGNALINCTNMVELATFVDYTDADKKKQTTVIVSSLQPDLGEFAHLEREVYRQTYNRKNVFQKMTAAKPESIETCENKQEALWKNDKNSETRHKEIIQNLIMNAICSKHHITREALKKYYDGQSPLGDAKTPLSTQKLDALVSKDKSPEADSKSSKDKGSVDAKLTDEAEIDSESSKDKDSKDEKSAEKTETDSKSTDETEMDSESSKDEGSVDAKLTDEAKIDSESSKDKDSKDEKSAEKTETDSKSTDETEVDSESSKGEGAVDAKLTDGAEVDSESSKDKGSVDAKLTDEAEVDSESSKDEGSVDAQLTDEAEIDSESSKDEDSVDAKLTDGAEVDSESSKDKGSVDAKLTDEAEVDSESSKDKNSKDEKSVEKTETDSKSTDKAEIDSESSKDEGSVDAKLTDEAKVDSESSKDEGSVDAKLTDDTEIDSKSSKDEGSVDAASKDEAPGISDMLDDMLDVLGSEQPAHSAAEELDQTLRDLEASIEKPADFAETAADQLDALIDELGIQVDAASAQSPKAPESTAMDPLEKPEEAPASPEVPAPEEAPIAPEAPASKEAPIAPEAPAPEEAPASSEAPAPTEASDAPAEKAPDTITLDQLDEMLADTLYEFDRESRKIRLRSGKTLDLDLDDEVNVPVKKSKPLDLDLDGDITNFASLEAEDRAKHVPTAGDSARPLPKNLTGVNRPAPSAESQSAGKTGPG